MKEYPSWVDYNRSLKISWSYNSLLRDSYFFSYTYEEDFPISDLLSVDIE